MDENERETSRKEWWSVEIVDNEMMPQEVRAVREKLGLDYGRIDWAFNNGKPIVFDANKTPSGIGIRSLQSSLDHKRHSLICEFSKGIESF